MVAYWIAHVDVSDPESYEAYRSANALAFNKFKGRFIVRGGKSKVVEGNVRSRTVIIEFDDYDTANACFDSKEYQDALLALDGGANRDCRVFEGL